MTMGNAPVYNHPAQESVQVKPELIKLLTFILDGEEYAVDILKVQEIIGIIEITPVPKTKPYIKGVINLRGYIIPVIDLRKLFEMAEIKYTDLTCIVIIKSGGITMGLIVDMVSDVIDVGTANLQKTPDFGVSVKTAFINSIVKSEHKPKYLINLEKIIGIDENSVNMNT